jgi:hypothetical protein
MNSCGWPGSHFSGPAAEHLEPLPPGRSRAFPKNVGELWQKLDGKRKFPLKELVPMQRQLR